jgi:hypothetical protein
MKRLQVCQEVIELDGELKMFRYLRVGNEQEGFLPTAETAWTRIQTMEPEALRKLVAAELHHECPYLNMDDIENALAANQIQNRPKEGI